MEKPGQIPDKVLDRYQDFLRTIESRDHWRPFIEVSQTLDDVVSEFGIGSMNFEANSLLWGKDVADLVKEIAINLSWMQAYGSYIQSLDDYEQGSYFQVNTHADHAILRIYSCRDKLAAMVLAFYVPFDPSDDENLPSFREALAILRNPDKIRKFIKRHQSLGNLVGSDGESPFPILDCQEFLEAFEILNSESFEYLANYRHAKVHRREPRIIVGNIQSCYGASYVLPVMNRDHWWRDLENMYPNAHKSLLEKIEESSTRDGILYEARKPQEYLFEFEAVRWHTTESFERILRAGKQCFSRLVSDKRIRLSQSEIDELGLPD